MGATWAGRLTAAIGLCLAAATVSGDEPSRSYIFFPPPQSGSPGPSTGAKGHEPDAAASAESHGDAASSGAKTAEGQKDAASKADDGTPGPSSNGAEKTAAERNGREASSAADASASGTAPRAEIQAARAELAERLKALPAVAEKGTSDPSKGLREALEERQQWLADWEKALAERAEAEHPRPDPEKLRLELKADGERTRALLEQFAKDPDSVLAAVFRNARGKAVSDAARAEMKETIESTQNDVKDWIQKEEKLQPDLATPAEARLAALRSERDKLEQNLATFKARRAERAAGVASAKTREARAVARERQQNLEWEARVGAERLRAKEAQIALEAKNLELAALRLDVAKAHEELSKKTLQRMQEYYRALAAREESALQQAAASEAKRAAKSDDPLERFRARRTAELLELEALVKKGDNAVAASTFPSETDEHEKTVRASEDLALVKRLLDDGRVSQLDALRLNNDFRRIGPERERIEKFELRANTDHLTRLENSLSNVELALVNDQRDDRYELDDLLERLPRRRWAEARAVTEQLEQKHTELLHKRKKNLETLIDRAEKAQNEIESRLRILDEEYGFIRTHIFWVRDQEPLGRAWFLRAQRESAQVAKALARLGAELGDRTAWGRVSPEFVLALVLGLLLPWPITRASQWMGSGVPVHCESRTTLCDMKHMLRDIAASSLWPGYVALFAYAARQAPWPRGTALLTAALIAGAAASVFAVAFVRTHLRPRGWAEVVLQLPTPVARQMRQAYHVLIAAGLLLLLPSAVLTQGMLLVGGRSVVAPSVSRVCDLLFGLVIAGVVFFLARDRSPFVEWLVHVPERLAWVRRRRRALAWSLLALITSGVVLDALGYSFTAHRLGIGALQTLAIAIACWGLYRALAQAIDHQAWRWIRPAHHEPLPNSASDASGLPTDLAARLRRLVGYLVPVVGLAFAAWVWEIDGSLFRFLGEQVLVQFSDGKDAQGKPLLTAVTFADLTQGILIVLVTAAVWRHLSTFFAVAVFPRMPDDPGVRFAVLTLCRYGVLAAGMLAAMMSVKIGPAQLGMAMAAVGVGLGFGLQEIVSNFVCGIILLLERPIRVGDIVTVENMTGQVDRINIRATTIINGDNQSLLIPNRAFITGDLINWTLKDKVIRVSVRMKVAPGNNPDRVTDLLLSIAREDPDVLRNPIPAALLEDIADRALVFVLHVHVPDPSLGGRVKHRLLTHIQQRFKDAGIASAVPSQEFIVRPAPDAAVSFFTAPMGIHRVDPGATLPAPPHWLAGGAAAEPREEISRSADESSRNPLS